MNKIIEPHKRDIQVNMISHPLWLEVVIHVQGQDTLSEKIPWSKLSMLRDKACEEMSKLLDKHEGTVRNKIINGTK